MRKLIQGIVDFRRTRRADYAEKFAELALGQQPDAVFFTCSDSRVAANVFASTDPGDLFVVRAVGNMVAPADASGVSTGDQSEASAIEYSVNVLGVRQAIVCGHSSCGAMKGLLEGVDDPRMPNLKAWLRHGEGALARLRGGDVLDPRWPPVDQLSQLNVLEQMDHIATYPAVAQALAKDDFAIYGLWFDIRAAEVHLFAPDRGRFVALDETEAEVVLRELADHELPPKSKAAGR